MSGRDPVDSVASALCLLQCTPLEDRSESDAMSRSTAVVGELIAFISEARTPLVRLRCSPGAPVLPARSVVPLNGSQIGQHVVLVCEHGDPTLPIILGVLTFESTCHLPQLPAQVEVRADGAQMIVSARDRLVLRCGKASITLTRAGKIVIEGEYISSRAVGAHRIRGGSVELN